MSRPEGRGNLLSGRCAICHSGWVFVVVMESLMGCDKRDISVRLTKPVSLSQAASEAMDNKMHEWLCAKFSSADHGGTTEASRGQSYPQTNGG